MKAFHLVKNISWSIFFSFIFFIIFSCSQNRPHETKEFVKTDKIKLPIVVPAGTPIVVCLDSCPAPYNILIPTKDSVDHVFNTSQGPFHVKFGPPTIKPADFFIDMPVYDDEKGLAINSIMSGFQDRMGNLWFGTNGGGLTRYDGNSSVTFTAAEGLGNNQPRDIKQDSAGNLWFVMGGGGVAKYDGRKFTNYTTKDGLAFNEVRSVTIDKKNQIWFGTFGGGISRYDGKTFTTYNTLNGLSNDKIWCSVQDKNGDIWFGTVGTGISCFDGKSFKNFSTNEGLINNTVRSINEDKLGNIWIGTEFGVSKYDGRSFTNFTTAQGLSNNSVHRIIEDNSGNIWFGTYGGGVSRYNGKTFLNFTENQGLKNNFIRSIVKDKSGNLWFGSYGGGGVNYYRGESIINFTTKQGLPNNLVRGILKDKKGNFWFGTNAGGVCLYDGSFFTHYTTKQGLQNNTVHTILEDKKGNIWFATDGGMTKYDGKSFTNFTARHGLGAGPIRNILEDTKENLWFCSELGGITKFDGERFITFNKDSGLPVNDVRAIIEDKNENFWIGTHGGGICRFDGKNFTVFNTDQGLANNFIFSMREDKKGNIWICTGNGGISILKKEILDKINTQKKIDFEIFENFTTKEGLADDVVYDLAEDKKGNIFVGTNLGITVIKGGAKPNTFIERDSIEYYHWKVGYPIKDAVTKAMYADDNDIIWMGTSGGLIRFDYSSIHKDLNPPEVRIKTIKVDNQSITWYNLLLNSRTAKDSLTRKNIFQSLIVEEAIVFGNIQSQPIRDSLQKKFGDIKFDSITPYYPLPVNLELPHKHNSVTFSFAAIETARPAQVHYQYKLENYDAEWSPITTQTTANFGNMHEGNYTFKIKAQSPDGVWSEPVEYSFVVLPPIWRTWWAIAIYVLTAGAFLFFGIRYRIASVRKKEQERAKHEKELLELEAKALRAQMNPHFVFNCLNSIKSLIQQHEEEKSVTYLTTFSKLIRTLFNNADKKEISLYDEIETCKLYLKLEAMRFDTRFSYSINVDENIDLKSIQIPALIVQPFIENAIWHGIVPGNNGGHISLDVVKQDSIVEIIVDDNGIGRETSRQNRSVTNLTHQSKGVNLTQSRLELNNLLQQRQAKLETIDKKDENGKATGTAVFIRLKEDLS